MNCNFFPAPNFISISVWLTLYSSSGYSMLRLRNCSQYFQCSQMDTLHSLLQVIMTVVLYDWHLHQFALLFECSLAIDCMPPISNWNPQSNFTIIYWIHVTGAANFKFERHSLHCNRSLRVFILRPNALRTPDNQNNEISNQYATFLFSLHSFILFRTNN